MVLDPGTFAGPAKPGMGTELRPGLGPIPEERLRVHDLLSLFQQSPPLHTPRARAQRKSNPKLEEVRKKADADVAFWSIRNERFEEHQKLIEMIEPDVPDDEDGLRLNDSLTGVLKVAGMLSKQEENIEFRPRRPDLKDSAQAGENALRKITEEREARHADALHGPVKYEEFIYGLVRGWYVARITFDSTVAAEWDGDAYEYFPWQIGLVDSANVYPNNATEKFTRVTHRYTTTVGDLRDTSDLDTKVLDNQGWEDDEMVEVTGVYELNKRWDYHCVFISKLGSAGGGKDDVWLKKPQPLGYMPWVIVLAGGFPFRGVPWATGSSKEFTRYMGMGILHGIAMIQGYLERYISMYATMVGDSANPFTAIISDSPEDEPPEGGLKRGGHKRFRKDTKLEQLTREKGMEAVAPLIQLLQDREDKGLMPRVAWAQGGPDGTINSGYQASLFMAASHDLVFPYVRSWELFRRKIYRRCLEIFADFAPLDQPLMVTLPPTAQTQATTWAEFWPEDVDEQGTEVSVTLDPMTLQDKINLGQLAVMLVKENIIARETARGVDFLRIKDPKLEDLKIISELTRMHPTVIEMMVPLATAMTGEQLAGILFQMAISKGQPGAPGQPGQPEQPGMMPGQVAPPQAQGMNQDAAMAARGAPPNAAAVGGVGPGGLPPPPPMTNRPL